MIHTAINAIIDTIPSGCIFDSHFIIEQLIQNYSDEYILFVSKFSSSLPPMTTVTAHGNIGQEIAKFDGTLIRQLPNNSYSFTIHDTPGQCAAWQKI